MLIPRRVKLFKLIKFKRWLLYLTHLCVQITCITQYRNMKTQYENRSIFNIGVNIHASKDIHIDILSPLRVIRLRRNIQILI